MKLLKFTSRGLAAGVMLAALAMPVEKAGASVIGYSSLQITNFTAISGAEIINIPSVTVVNTTTSAAGLNGTNVSNSSPVNGAPGAAGVADSDVALSCVGQCGGIAQNDFSSVAPANPGWHFGRGDASLQGSFLIPGGMNGRVVGETQLNFAGSSYGNSAIQSISNLSTIDFTTSQSGDLALTMDVLGELRAFSDEASGVAIVDFDFDIQLFDITNGGMLDIGISSVNGATNFNGLNQARSAIGVQELNYLVDDTFTLTMNGLLSDTNYRLQITQNADVSASSGAPTAVPEPGALTLLGFGLLGIAMVAVRRQQDFMPVR